MKIILNPLSGLPNITSTRWGEIKGDIADQEDLISLITTGSISQLYEVVLVDGYYSEWNRLYETSTTNPEEKNFLSGV